MVKLYHQNRIECLEQGIVEHIILDRDLKVKLL